MQNNASSLPIIYNLHVMLLLIVGNVVFPGLSMGMSFIWESHGKRPMEWDSTHFPWDSEIQWECQNVTELSYLDYTFEF